MHVPVFGRRCPVATVLGIVSLFVICFISVRAKINTIIYTPCNYPLPGSQLFRDRCSSYVNLDYLCDIDGLMSKTAADQIHLTVNKYDYYKNFDVHIAVATLPVVYLPVSLPRFKYQSMQDSDWNCTGNNGSREIVEILQWRNGTSAKRYIDWFGRVLSSRWFGNDCGSFILFFSVTRYVADWDRRKLLEFPLVQISVGRQLRQDLGDGYYDIIQRDIVTWHSEGLSSVKTIIKVLDQVAHRLNQIKDEKHKKFEHTIPFWAIYVFMGCFAVLALALLLDCLVVRKKALSLRGGSGGSGAHGAVKKSENVQVHLYF